MDSKTSLVILERVKAAREKQANEYVDGAANTLLPLLLAGGVGAGIGGIHAAATGKKIGRGAAKGGLIGGATGLGAYLGGGLGAAGGGIAGYGLASEPTPAERLTRSTVGTDDPLRGNTALRGALIGAGLGGVGGTVAGGGLGFHLSRKALKDDEKQANDPSIDAFSGALQNMAATQLKSDAFRDVRNVGLTALGVGAAGRGLVGLIQQLKSKPKKTRSGPAYLPLPFPASPEKVGSAGQALGDITSATGTDVGAGAGAVGGAALAKKLLGRLPGGRGKMLGGLGMTAAGGLAGGLGGNQMGRGLIGRPSTEPGAGQFSTAVGDNLAAGGALGGAGAGAAAGAGASVLGLKGIGKVAPSLMRNPKAGLAAALGTAGLTGLGAYEGGVGGNSIVRSLLGRNKTAGFLDGDMATTKGGIPWYGPAMLLGGLGGLGLGWKGMDKVIDGQRKKQMEGELVSARQQFHDALLGQYDKPVEMHPELMSKKSADETMVKVGQALDALFDKFTGAMAAEEAKPTEKSALDVSNLAGQAAGGYGMYAGLSGLLTGALVYDKIQKRSRRSVLESALKKRQRRRFMQQPTEIYAQPEPVDVGAGG